MDLGSNDSCVPLGFHLLLKGLPERYLLARSIHEEMGGEGVNLTIPTCHTYLFLTIFGNSIFRNFTIILEIFLHFLEMKFNE